MKKNIFILVFLFTYKIAVSQCAMCKAVIEGDGNENIAQGVNNGITYLMIFPYILVGILAYFLIRYRQKAKN